MLKVAHALVDVHNDFDNVIAHQLPSFCHQLMVSDPEVVDALPDCRFAAVVKTAGGAIRRRWPLETADDIKLSAAYLDQMQALLPPVIYGMACAKVAAATARLAGDEEFQVDGVTLKTAEADSAVAYVDTEKLSQSVDLPAEHKWGLVIEGKNYFPLTTPTLVKEAAARFPFTCATLMPEQCFVYARNIAKQAQALDVELPEDSRVRLYTYNAVNTDSLAAAIAQRKEAAVATGLSTQVLDELGVLAGCHLVRQPLESDASFQFRQEKQASLSIQPDQIIQILQAFDAAAGITKQAYNRGMLDPFAACFKEAAINAYLVDGLDLSRVDTNQLAQVFGPEFSAKFKQDPVNTYKGLPSQLRRLVSSVIKPPRPPEGQPLASRGDPLTLTNPTYSNGTCW